MIIDMKRFPALLTAFGLTISSPLALAKVDADEAAKLGKELTAIGAEQAGNGEEGWKAIPPWEGGIKEAPEGFESGVNMPLPFPEDEILLEITADNYEEYEDYLTEGHKAMFKTYPDTWVMNVYASNRTSAYQDWVYDASIENATKVELKNEGNGIKGTAAGYPFPIPNNGQEVIWNHQLRNRGVKGVHYYSASALVQRDGNYEIGKSEGRVLLYYNNDDYTVDTLDNRLADLIVKIHAPQRNRGEAYLLNITIDRKQKEPKVWFYSPGLRRTKVFETPGYDEPLPNSEGLVTIDQIDMFNGPVDRYSFDIVGKQEILMPYNAYKLWDREIAYDEILKPGHPNTDLLRYEMHRVWILEATVREEFQHIYPRRVFYIDEDSWEILMQDIYDAEGEFWRFSETHPLIYYQIPTFGAAAQFHYDLQSRQYLCSGFSNEEDPPEFIVPREKEFTLGAFKREMK